VRSQPGIEGVFSQQIQRFAQCIRALAVLPEKSPGGPDESG